jgi:hypothetical protein
MQTPPRLFSSGRRLGKLENLCKRDSARSQA